MRMGKKPRMTRLLNEGVKSLKAKKSICDHLFQEKSFVYSRGKRRLYFRFTFQLPADFQLENNSPLPRHLLALHLTRQSEQRWSFMEEIESRRSGELLKHLAPALYQIKRYVKELHLSRFQCRNISLLCDSARRVPVYDAAPFKVCTFLNAVLFKPSSHPLFCLSSSLSL